MGQLSRRQFLRIMGLAGMSALPVPGALPLTRRQQTPKSIRVLAVGNPYGIMLPYLNQTFTEKTGITVNFEVISAADIIDRARRSVDTQTPDADVLSVDQAWHGQFVENGWILPLDGYARADSDTRLDDFVPQVLYGLNTYNGHLWSLPVDTYVRCILYRRDLFESRGLPLLPKDPAQAKDWTWGKYLGYVKALHGIDFQGTKFFGTSGVGVYRGQSSIIDHFSQLTMSYKAPWFRAFPDAAAWDFTPMATSDEALNALVYLQQLTQYAPPESVDYNEIDQKLRFGHGDIAMMMGLVSYYDWLKDEGYYSGKTTKIIGLYDVALMPTLAPGGERPVWLGGWSLGIASTSPQQDAAWQYIKWASSAETQRAMALVPDYNYQFSNFARYSLIRDADLVKRYPALPLLETLIKNGQAKRARPPAPVYADLVNVYGEQIYHALKGDIAPEDALDNVDIRFRSILSNAKLLPYGGASYADTFENAVKLIAALQGPAQ